MEARETLDRTLLISRILLGEGAHVDAAVLHQLTSTAVGLVANEDNLRSVAGQTALVTMSGLVLAHGMSVVLSIPEVEVIGAQPPLQGRSLRRGLMNLAAEAIPGCRVVGPDSGLDPDLIFVLGDSPQPRTTVPTWRLTGDDWRGGTVPPTEHGQLWSGALPFGACVSAAIASMEPYKYALANAARTLDIRPQVPELLAPTARAAHSFGDGLPKSIDLDLGDVDFISAGAINTSALHVLHRVPKLRASGRIFDGEKLDASNLNRYPLALRRNVGQRKVDVLTQWNSNSIRFQGIHSRYGEANIGRFAALANNVVVGTDDVKARWLVQGQWPRWLGVGATADFMTLTSEHVPGQPCAGCLHPVDDDVDLTIPTLSTVSYWAGLLVAVRLLRHALGVPYPPNMQALTLWPLRMDYPTSVLWQPVHRHASCPVETTASGRIERK